MSVALRVLGSVALVGALGAGNVARETCWSPADGFVCGPFRARAAGSLIGPVAVSGLTRVEIPAPGWRPLSLDLSAGGPAELRVSGSGLEPTGIPGGAVTTIVTRQPPPPTGRVVLWIEPGSASAPGTLASAAVAPVLEPVPVARSISLGAGVGVVLAWLLWFSPRLPSRGTARDPHASPASGSPPRRRTTAFAAPIALLAIVHGAWIVLKPPLQSPDEPQHHARATSAPNTPFVAGTRTVVLAAPHRNPLTWTPNRLHAIIQRPSERLSDDDVRTLRATAWPPQDAYPPVEAVPSPIASYPGLYYWLVFALGELAKAALALSPYASLLAYRAASVLLAGAVWLAVYGQLRRSPDLRPWALPVFVVLAANPVTASITASVTPDAMVIPATVLLLLATWRRLTAGGSVTPLVIGALVAVAVKPSGLLAIAAAMAGVAWWALQARRYRSGQASATLPVSMALGIVRPLALVALIAYVVFYAWSPPTLVIEPAHAGDSLVTFLASVAARAPSWWVEYWGRLGWVEYGAPMAWYWGLLAACGALLVAAWRRPASPDDRGVAGFAIITSVAYAALLLAGEYLHLKTAPLFVQGRYLLPACLWLIPLVRQRRLALAWTLPLMVLALHLALAAATINRYFGNGWAGWLASLR